MLGILFQNVKELLVCSLELGGIIDPVLEKSLQVNRYYRNCFLSYGIMDQIFARFAE